MSPIEYIAEGIRQGNWETVCEGYEKLTGESLSLPKTVTTDGGGEALQQIVDIASSVLGESIAGICNLPIKSVKRKPGRPKGSGKKIAKKKMVVTEESADPSIKLDDNLKTTVQKEKGGVRLITNNPDQEEIERNKAKATKTGKNRVSSSRKIANKYKVKCNECEKMFESDRPDGEMGQKCDQCLREKKSRFS